MESCVEVMHRAKIYVYRPMVVSIFMDVYLMAGQIDEGIRVFREELDHYPITGERIMESEIRRLFGEFLVRQNRPQQAEEASLAQLWLSQDSEKATRCCRKFMIGSPKVLTRLT